jgi:5'-AMP-activated protein kinase catalytic alpha subunit
MANEGLGGSHHVNGHMQALHHGTDNVPLAAVCRLCKPQVVRLGFDRQLLLDSLRARQQNKATVTYYLLADNRRGLSASAYLSGELNEGGAAASAAAAAAAGWGRSASLGGPSTAGAGRDSTGGGLPQQRLVAERKWRLGLGLRGHPSALMGEVYRALAATGCGWKKLGPYALKCRKVVVVHPSRLSRMSEDGASDMSGAGGNGREPGATSSSSSGGGPGGGGAVEDMASETSPGLGGQPAHPHLLRPTTSASGGPGTAVTSSFAGGHPGGGTPGAPTAGSGSGAGGSGRPPPAAVLTPDGSGVEYLVKFELALYKVREEEYALDVQVRGGGEGEGGKRGGTGGARCEAGQQCAGAGVKQLEASAAPVDGHVHRSCFGAVTKMAAGTGGTQTMHQVRLVLFGYTGSRCCQTLACRL